MSFRSLLFRGLWALAVFVILGFCISVAADAREIPADRTAALLVVLFCSAGMVATVYDWVLLAWASWRIAREERHIQRCMARNIEP